MVIKAAIDCELNHNCVIYVSALTLLGSKTPDVVGDAIASVSAGATW